MNWFSFYLFIKLLHASSSPRSVAPRVTPPPPPPASSSQKNELVLGCRLAPAKNSFLRVKCFKLSFLTGTISYNNMEGPRLEVLFTFGLSPLCSHDKKFQLMLVRRNEGESETSNGLTNLILALQINTHVGWWQRGSVQKKKENGIFFFVCFVLRLKCKF